MSSSIHTTYGETRDWSTIDPGPSATLAHHTKSPKKRATTSTISSLSRKRSSTHKAHLWYGGWHRSSRWTPHLSRFSCSTDTRIGRKGRRLNSLPRWAFLQLLCSIVADDQKGFYSPKYTVESPSPTSLAPPPSPKTLCPSMNLMRHRHQHSTAMSDSGQMGISFRSPNLCLPVLPARRSHRSLTEPTSSSCAK
jgi:hypothetical protein